MAFLNFARVSALPATLEPSTLYMVKGTGSLLDMYATGDLYDDGNGNMIFDTRHVISKTEINTMISEALANFNTAAVVNNIAERDALPDDSSFLCVVLDASDDLTVGSGGATYVWNETGAAWVKTGELGTIDLELSWGRITGKPTSTVAQIDDAVAKAHTHANKTVLDGIGANGGGNLTFNGVELHGKVVLTAAEW